MPYDTDEMYFDPVLQMYVLTPVCAQRIGLNMEARVRQKGAVNGEIIVKQTLQTVSMQIYQFLHSRAMDTVYQDEILSCNPEARPVLQRALEQQLLYYMQVGNLSRSVDPKKRALAIDMLAKDILENTILPSLGHSLAYTGRW